MPTLAAAVCLIAGVLTAAPSGEEDAIIRRWTELYADRARAIVATEQQDEPRQLTVHPNALLHYSNPVRPHAQHGAVHLWVDRGLPRMIGAVWSAEDQDHREQRNLCYEFHSLSEFPLDVTIDNTSVKWTPHKPGVEWIAIKGVPAPHQSRAGRRPG